MSFSAYLTSLPSLLVLCLFVVLLAGLTIAGALLIRRRFPHDVMKKHHEAAGFVFATVGVLYAVILAFALLEVWEQYNAANSDTEHEAGSVMALGRHLAAWPSDSTEIAAAKRFFVAFVHSVLEKEFPAMREMKPAPETTAAFGSLVAAIQHLNPVTAREIGMYTAMLGKLDDIQGHRDARLVASRDEIPRAIWIAIWFGALVTIGFALLFSTETFWPKLLITSGLAAMIAVVIFVIIVTDHPFVGEMRVKPEGYERVAQTIPADWK